MFNPSKKIMGFATLSLSIAISATLIGKAVAQNTDATTEASTQAPSICQTVDAFNDFDFWVGNWQVIDNNTTKFSGSNSVVKVVQNCMVLENWVDASGSTGKSINYFNPITNKWRQVWIGSSGYLIDIEGGLIDGAMVLEGTISTFGNHKEYPFKGTWRKLERGKVQQVFHQFDPLKQEWVVWFDGTYTPSR
jgi:hypothetical protein